MPDLTEGSLAASLMYEGVCDVDEHSGFNRIRNMYLPHMAPRAAAVEQLTKAAREMLDRVVWSDYEKRELVPRWIAAIEDSEHWKERRPGE